MQQTKQEILEKLKVFTEDKNFIFDPVKHKYTYNGDYFINVTTFLENFIKPFDKEYWSLKKAKEANVEQSVILEKWDAKRDKACDLGHTVHAWIEDYYELNETALPEDEEVLSRVNKFLTLWKNKLHKLESVATEIRVFSKKHKIAGTIDKLYLIDGLLILCDWKTNEKIKTDKDYCFNMLLEPFNKYKENELNKYSLQLSLYALMLREAGVIVDYSIVCHLPPKTEPQIIKLKDFRAELEDYLNNKLDINKIVEQAKSKSTIDVIW